jgi:F0F1-type ATP synthase assembly protein I
MMRVVFSGPGERNEMGRALMLGMNFAVGMAVFSFLGYFIDQKRGDGAIFFTVVGIVAGLAYGAYEVWIVIRMLNAQVRKVEGGSQKSEVRNQNDEES